MSASDGVTLLTSLISNIKSKQVPKRALFRGMNFEIGPGLRISVKGYNIIERQRPARSAYIWENGEKSQIAQIVSKRIAEDSAEEIPKPPKKTKADGDSEDKDPVKRNFKLGGKFVPMDEEELRQLKDFGTEHDRHKKPLPILRIIGFKPEKLLPIWAAVKKSTFIYPSEDDFVGSTRVFVALHKKLLKDKLVGIAWFAARKNAMPIIVAILPSLETFSKSGQQISPAGLWLYPLPFADDLRPLPALPAPVVADGSLIDHIRMAMKQLQLPNARFDPTLYPNPALQWHYQIIQAMALDEELPDVPDDKCVPRYRVSDPESLLYKRIALFGVTWYERH